MFFRKNFKVSFTNSFMYSWFILIKFPIYLFVYTNFEFFIYLFCRLFIYILINYFFLYITYSLIDKFVYEKLKTHILKTF